MFVLAGGFDASDQIEPLTEQYRDDNSGKLDFSVAERVTSTVHAWTSETQGVAKKAAQYFARDWCQAHRLTFEEQRLLIRYYVNESGQSYLVGGYFPSRADWPDDQNDSGDEPLEVDDDEDLSIDPCAVAIATVTTPHDDSMHASPEHGHHQQQRPESADTASKESVTRPWKSRAAQCAQSALAWLERQPTSRLIGIGGSIAATLIVLIVWAAFFRGSDSSEQFTDEPSGDDDATALAGAAGTTPEPVKLATPKFETGTLRVYTSSPGFHVLIDQEPVLNAQGELVTTPCELTAERGVRTVTVFREGSFDLSSVVEIKDDGEVEFEASTESTDRISPMKARLRKLKAGESIELKAINTARDESDPWISADGLSLWFAGDRDDGRGIFLSTRGSPFDEFAEPRIVLRSPDVAGTPSLTDDALHLVYSVPSKARLMSVNRDNPLVDFVDKQPLLHSDSRAPIWPSSQVIGNGLRVYWVESQGSTLTTFGAVRRSKDVDFGKPFKVAGLPGTHPCLSQDGLRQFVLRDGEIVRYRRTAANGRFAEEATLGKVEVDGFEASLTRRQIAVTQDEQWAVVCAHPELGGDLFLVRLSDGPQWGVKPTGKSIPAKQALVKMEPDPKKEMMAEISEAELKPKPKPVDPRSLPLPYATHLESFVTLLGARNYSEAEALLKAARNNPAMQPFAEPLGWDEQELRGILDFWSTIERIVGELKPGQKIRLGSNELEVVSVQDGQMALKRGTAEVTKKVAALTPSELSSLFDKNVATDDSAAQFQFGVFLSFEPNVVQRSRDVRMARAAKQADEFEERRAQRKLLLAKAELQRSNFAAGIAFLKEAKLLAGKTKIAVEADRLEASLYDYVKWRPIGPRQWKVDGNEWTAALGRSRGSGLLSELEYASFELSLEWKVENDTAAQGGVFFRYSGSGDFNENALKIQLANDAGISPDNFSTGALFGMSPADENLAKPPGEWNTLMIKLVGDRITVFINDKKVLATIAQKEGTRKRGHVALDGSIGGISYRKILLSELPDP